MKKILIIADHPKNFKIQGDSTYLLLLTAHELGYSINYCNADNLLALNDQAFADVQPLHLRHGLAQIHTTPDWFSLDTVKANTPLTSFDLILVRSDPPFNMEYYYLTQILDLVTRQGVKVLNSASALRNFNEKLTILNFPQHIPATLVSKNKSHLKQFMENNGFCVVKPIDMMAGRGVFKISLEDPNCDAILEQLTDYFTQTVMIQRFIPEVVQGDKRIFIINGRVIEHCLYRIPQNGQIRGNLAVGGRGEVHPLNAADYVIAEDVAKWLQQENIQIGKCLTEVNITSPTGAQQIYAETGINIFEALLKDN
jgi:glutathione synthase